MAAKKKKAKPPRPSGPPTIHEATLDSGPSGAVLRGLEISLETAIARRQVGLDVVVCGGSLRENRALARKIESAVGPAERQQPHKRAGPHTLPHFQPEKRPPKGHTFYETEQPGRKARKQS
jgi:hypothetical protein